MHPKHLLVLALVVEGGLAALAWGLGVALGRPAFEKLDLDWTAWVWGGLATLPPLAGLMWARRTRWGPLARLGALIEVRVAPLFSRCTLVDLALISALAGVGEEALFRGVLQPWLGGILGPWPAVVVVGIAFGLAHWLTPTYAVYAALMGVYLGALYHALGNLWVPIFAHAAYDFVALAVLVRGASSAPRPDRQALRVPQTPNGAPGVTAERGKAGFKNTADEDQGQG